MSDWLSPILVKELRQGLRARSFEGAFLLMQVLMLFAVLLAVLAVGTDKSTGFTVMVGEGVFWAMLSIPVLLVMPMRGCNALRSEMDGKSLELIFLTRLSAWRIVTGKWAALFGQTCLLVVAVMPYAVLRYYLGGVDLVRDAMVIAVLLGSSALLTALTVSLSGFSSKLARSMVFVFPVVVLMFGPSFVFGVATSIRYGPGGFPLASTMSGRVWLGGAFYGLAALAYLLEIGASRIAPIAENHALRKRLLGMLLLLSGPAAWWIGGEPELLWLPFLLLIPVCVDSLCRPGMPVPGNLVPLRRFRLGRVFAPLLLPGWPSGFLYTCTVFTVQGILLFAAGELAADNARTGFIACFGAVLFPLACIRLAVPAAGRRIGTATVVIHVLLFIVTLMLVLVDELFDLEAHRVLYMFPLSILMLMIPDSPGSEAQVAASAILAACLLVILFRSAAPWSRMRELLRTSLDPSAPPNPPAYDVAP